MSLIYKPQGRAGEYAKLALNIYKGCDHRCEYCFAPLATHAVRDEFCKPTTRKDDFLKKLEAEAKKLKPSDPVLLCFTCDPYCLLDTEKQLTRSAIQILHRYGHHIHILTKGGRRAIRDLDLMTPNDAFSTTLTCLDEATSRKWEPGAATPADRIETARQFHDAGIPTWVSLEPVLDPDVALEIIRRTHTYVDLFKVGKLNYHAHAKTINWAKFAKEAVELLDSLGCKYYVKKDLLKYLTSFRLYDSKFRRGTKSG